MSKDFNGNHVRSSDGGEPSDRIATHTNGWHNEIYRPENLSQFHRDAREHHYQQQSAEAHGMLNGFRITGSDGAPPDSRDQRRHRSHVATSMEGAPATIHCIDNKQQQPIHSYGLLPIYQQWRQSHQGPPVRNAWANDIQQAANPINGFQSFRNNLIHIINEPKQHRFGGWHEQRW
jgi:hypothetical protein